MIRIAAVAALAVSTAVSAGPATAPAASAASGPPLRILSLQVLVGSGPAVARGTLDRSKRYSYRVEYTLGGSAVARVTRAATIEDPSGSVVALVRPPAAFTDPGRYRVTSRIRVGPDDPPGTYILRYTITARVPGGGTTRRQREILMRFGRAAVVAPLPRG